MLVNNVAHVSLIFGALWFSACIKDVSADTNTGREQTTLCGKSLGLHDRATGRCLDSNADGKVYAIDCNGGNFQLWNITCSVVFAADGFPYRDRIRDVATGRCLDSNTSGEVYTLPCNGGPFQQWTVYADAYGSTIKDVATGRCLDSNADGKVYAIDCNGGNFQHWQLK